MIYFAGYAAERRFDRKANSAGSCDDDEKALEILERLREAASEDEYRTEADTFVTKHWAEIKALAAELVERETISDSSESELIIDVARGEATAEELATYRALKAQ